MSAFEPALEVVLAHEGGWSNDPRDPGGPTNLGITLRTALAAKGVDFDLDDDGDVDAEDIRALDRSTAALFYRGWWDRFGYRRIVDQDCATKLFDTAINLGPRPAHRIAQEAARDLGHPALAIDGVLGAGSVGAINACRPRAFLRAFCARQRAFYLDLVSRKPVLAAFRRTWLRRASWPLSAEAVV